MVQFVIRPVDFLKWNSNDERGYPKVKTVGIVLKI